MKGIKGVFYAILSSGTFGLIPLFTIPLVEELGVNEANVLFYRFFISSLLMGGVCLLRKNNLRIGGKLILSVLGLGLLYALTALFLVYSYNYIASGIATTIHFLYPLCVSLVMVFLFNEKQTKSLVVAAFLSLVGVALMCWTGGELHLLGVLLSGMTVLTYGFYIVGLNQLTNKGVSADVLTFYVILTGAILFFIYAQFDGGGVDPIPSFRAGLYLLLLAFLATVISDFALVLAVKHAGSTVTAVLGAMEPLVAVSMGVLVFAEYFGVQSFIGLLLVLFSVILVILTSRKEATVKEHEIVK